MKKGIHPKWNKDVKVMYNGKVIMTVGSTSPELQVEIWAGNHPFYTGKETLVDTDNLVDKFNKKAALAKKVNTTKKLKRQRRAETRRQTATNPLTLKDMLKNLQ